MDTSSHTKIFPYQSDWQKKFEDEKAKLKNIFKHTALEIEHIGSTSVEGLQSKPIIDIAVMVEDNKMADSFTEPLALVGYKFHSMSAERHFYTKGEPIEYHLSIAYANFGDFWPRQVLFRDYLRNHPEVRDEYAQLKAALLKKDPTGKGEYLSGKTEFVHKVLKLAGWKEGQKYRD